MMAIETKAAGRETDARQSRNRVPRLANSPPGPLPFGARYRVPCLLISGKRDRRWVPVWGPLHGDLEIGPQVAEPHYHYDSRFISDRLAVWLLGPYWREWELISVIHNPQPGERLEERPCQVSREAVYFPISRNFTARMEAKYADVQLAPGCRTCPHRGFPLGGLPIEEDGTVICRGHGLAWDLKTGRLVRRVPEAER